MTFASAVLEICRSCGFSYSEWENRSECGTVRFDMSAYTASLFLHQCEVLGVNACVVARGGLPHRIFRYRRRAGLLIGCLLGFAMIIASSRVLWDIRISGNEHMTVRQVREELATAGIYVGMLLDTFDPGECALQIQLCSENISWASINLSGTVAYVEIRERVPTPIEETILPANLVAGCEGVVEELEIYQGVPVVQSGQGVRQGDLLVSGVYDSQAVGWRVTRAAGRVLARTVREFTVEIPLEYEKKVYSDDASVKKTVIFFEKEIKLFKNSGILGVTCDKIDSIDSFTLGEGVSLPISVRTEYSFPYEYRRAERSYEQAEAIAYDELQRSIAQAVPEGVLLRKVITTTLGEGAYVLHCRVWCLENIAQLQPFTVESLSR